MTLYLLPLVAAVFIWAAVRRYRADTRALAVGIIAGLAATAGVALAVPQISQNLPAWLLTTWGCAAILVAILGSVYAEAKLKQAAQRGSTLDR